MPLADVLLHPQRLRIVQALLGRDGVTTAALRRELPDIAPATLYRHLSTLLEADVIEVVGERQVRGAVERTFVLSGARAVVDGDEARAMTVDQHRQAFLVFATGLIAHFDRYLDGGDVDLERDLVGYRQAPLHLTDAETVQMLGDLQAALLPWLERRPGPGRRRRLFTTVLMPGDPAEHDDPDRHHDA